MLELTSVKLNNFLSYQNQEFSFPEGQFLVLGENRDSEISQSNGSGKSSLFDAVIYAIYGKSDRNYQRRGTNDTFVELNFNYNDKSYKLIRYFKHKDYKNSVRIFENDEEITFHTKKDTQSLINSIFKLSYENFISSIIYKQGLSVKISTLKPTQRKEYFSNLITFDFNSVESAVKLDLTSLEKKLNEKQIEIQELKQQIAGLEGELKAYQSMSNNQNENINIEEVKSQLNELLIQINNQNEIINKLSAELELLNSEYRKNLNQITSQISSIQTKISQIDSLLSKSICPVCNQKIENKKLFMAKRNILSSQLNKLSNQKNELDKFYEAKISDLKSELNKRMEELRKLESKKAELLTLLNKSTNQQNINEDKIKELESKLNSLKSQLETYQSEYDNLSFEYERLKSFLKLVQPSGELRTVILLNYIELYNQILFDLIPNIFPEFSNIKLQISNDYKSIDITGVDYASLSGGEKRRLDFALQLTFSEFISYLSNVDINIRVFDEVFDGLDFNSINQIISFIKDFFPDKSVYFISHNDNLKSLFENTILVIKENGISRIHQS